MLDLSHARDENVFGTSHSEQFGSALIGLQFYVIDRHAADVFVHGLVGSALVDSALPTRTGAVIKGYVARFCMHWVAERKSPYTDLPRFVGPAIISAPPS